MDSTAIRTVEPLAPPMACQCPRECARTFLTWPVTEGPEHPHHCTAIRGWFSFGARGVWDASGIARDFREQMQFSECRVTDGADEPLKGWWICLTFSPADGVIVILREPMAGTYSLVVWGPSHDIAKQHFRALRDRYKRKPRRKRSASNFTVITMRAGGLMTRDIGLTSAVQSDDDLVLNYGVEFSEWNTHFLSQLRSRRSGVTIFRGEPGTGKTTYLRYLTRKLRRTHRFYFLPLTVYPLLSNPSAVDFWMLEQETYPKLRKIVILEDAESLLMERGSDNQANVSNLLNISDGFLGDVLNIHVICTINCSIDRIDPALLGPGRLVAMREFSRLSPTDGMTLAKAKGLPFGSCVDRSLAEIYNSENERREAGMIGFCRR